MKTSRALGAGLGLLAVIILRQFFYPVNKSSLFNGVNRDDISNSTISTTLDDQGKQSEKADTQQKESVISTETQFEQYTFHPKCPCQRRGPSLSNLELQFNSSTIESATHSSQPWKPTQGSYVGNSTCNRYTSALGAGQRVLSYTYYTPWNEHGGKFKNNGRPNDRSSARYAELLQPLATSVAELYPGWRMRIYHNVTQGALGDPTVEMFGSRDVDSYLMPREKAAVDEWMRKAFKQFHIMRDGPFHITTILAGLWGANNYHNLKKALNIRKRLLDVPVRHWKFYDQAVLHKRVWPAVRNFAMIHDSYNCGKGPRMGRMRPWPTQRDGFLYVGYGPTKGYAVRILRDTKCPLICRPPSHKYWQYC